MSTQGMYQNLPLSGGFLFGRAIRWDVWVDTPGNTL
jgi:hypothetical protein